MFSAIHEITFKISSYCNLDCVYCFQTRDSKTQDVPFTKYIYLVKFMEQLPLADRVEIKITGGESSLFIEQIRHAYRQLKKIERTREVKLWFTTISNGTNIEGILGLMNEGVLDAEGCKISWDGIHSASKSRKPKNPAYDDEFFKERIRTLGCSKWRDKVLVRIAVTPDTVDDLYASFRFALDCGCSKLEYYFLTDCDEYRNPEFASKFAEQLRLIAADHAENPFNWFNWDTLAFTELVLPKDNRTKLRSIGCRHLGRSLYIAANGDVYPCGFFVPDSQFGYCQYKLGNIEDGFKRETVEEFVTEYMKQPMCDYQYCDNLHCFECPALTKYRTGHMNHKLCQACTLRDIERQVFAEFPGKVDVEQTKRIFDFSKDWGISTDNVRVPYVE
ncbi:radical SAM protein [Anaeroselena agilis]|uniref:SPASM domain-containing protein n=1 Tax=Anaeroselena agilis TaxID=3063788 RepID=A0ABU3NVU8_9FIRM|nr:SPASM domain-containing protein [Selenomonadales bacterium 4137-cl]